MRAITSPRQLRSPGKEPVHQGRRDRLPADGQPDLAGSVGLGQDLKRVPIEVTPQCAVGREVDDEAESLTEEGDIRSAIAGQRGHLRQDLQNLPDEGDGRLGEIEFDLKPTPSTAGETTDRDLAGNGPLRLDYRVRLKAGPPFGLLCRTGKAPLFLRLSASAKIASGYLTVCITTSGGRSRASGRRRRAALLLPLVR